MKGTLSGVPRIGQDAYRQAKYGNGEFGIISAKNKEICLPWLEHSMNDNRRIVGLQEHLGTGNLGDEATVEAVLQQIRLRWPDTTIVAISLNPLDTEVRHGIPSKLARNGGLPDSERSEHRHPSAMLAKFGRKQKNVGLPIANLNIDTITSPN